MKCYHVDAFAEKVFEGNPAAVCVLDKYPSDELMLKIAIENNLSETAFAVKEGENYHLRWFTPGGEIDFCGAGDTFLSGFAAATAAGAGMIEAAKVACCCSAVTIKKLKTTGTASRAELAPVLKRY